MNILDDDARMLHIESERGGFLALPKPLLWMFIDAVTGIERTNRLLAFYSDIVRVVQDLLNGNMQPAYYSTTAKESLETSVYESKTLFAQFCYKAEKDEKLLEVFACIVRRLHSRYDYIAANRTEEKLEHFKQDIDKVKRMYLQILFEAHNGSKEEEQKALVELKEKLRQLGLLPFRTYSFLEKLMCIKPTVKFPYLLGLETPEDVAYKEIIQPHKFEYYKQYVSMVEELPKMGINDVSLETLKEKFVVLDEDIIECILAEWYLFQKDYANLRAIYQLGCHLLCDDPNIISEGDSERLSTRFRKLAQDIRERWIYYYCFSGQTYKEAVVACIREFKHELAKEIVEYGGDYEGLLSRFWDIAPNFFKKWNYFHHCRRYTVEEALQYCMRMFNEQQKPELHLQELNHGGVLLNFRTKKHQSCVCAVDAFPSAVNKDASLSATPTDSTPAPTDSSPSATPTHSPISTTKDASPYSATRCASVNSTGLGLKMLVGNGDMIEHTLGQRIARIDHCSKAVGMEVRQRYSR